MQKITRKSLLQTGTILMPILVISFHLYPIPGLGQSPNIPLETEQVDTWSAIPPYPHGSEKKFCAEWAQLDWKVTVNQQNKVIATNVYEFTPPVSNLPFYVPENFLDSFQEWVSQYGKRQIIEAPGGWIVSFNAGEWGGFVAWFSRDGKNNYEISKQQIIRFIEIKGEVFAIAGLSHLSVSKGSFLKLHQPEGQKWQFKELANLGDAPANFFVESDKTILIVTSQKLVRVYLDGKQELLIEEGSWETLNPNSIAATSSGIIYIGMKFAVARLTPTGSGFKEEWLVSPNCVALRKIPNEFECHCISKTVRGY